MSSHSQTESQSAAITTTTPSDNPPDYDTLSLAPPSINQSQPEPKKDGIRQKFAALKAEDERRKAERITHVSAEEADRITGLDRHRVEEERKSSERKRGGKSVLGILMMG